MFTCLIINPVTASTTVVHIAAHRHARTTKNASVHTSQTQPHSVKLRGTTPVYQCGLCTDKSGPIHNDIFHSLNSRDVPRIWETELAEKQNIYMPTQIWQSIGRWANPSSFFFFTAYLCKVINESVAWRVCLPGFILTRKQQGQQICAAGVKMSCLTHPSVRWASQTHPILLSSPLFDFPPSCV